MFVLFRFFSKFRATPILFFASYEVGVRIGVGVPLSRPPPVFPENLKWNVARQSEADLGVILEETRRDNYTTTSEYKEEVRRTLLDQASRGQILVLPEAKARSLYGSRLLIASLAAIRTSTREDGTTEVRIIHDGTHGLHLNTQIKVRGHIPLPMAVDVRQALIVLRQSGLPFFAATADVQEAHRQVHGDPHRRCSASLPALTQAGMSS